MSATPSGIDSARVFDRLDGVLLGLVMKSARTATGAGGGEAAITDTLSPGDTVLAARFGMFSHRWTDLCQRHGLNDQAVETKWVNGAPLAEIEAASRADTEGKIKAVLVTHNETATGVKSDIGGIREAMAAAGHDALLIVDGVSSIGSMPFDMDGREMNIAVVVPEGCNCTDLVQLAASKIGMAFGVGLGSVVGKVL